MCRCSQAIYYSLNYLSASQKKSIIFPKLVISAQKSFKFIYIGSIVPQKSLHFSVCAGTPNTWARTKIFWIWFICTLEGCVVLWTYLILKKVQIWNTLMYKLWYLECLIFGQMVIRRSADSQLVNLSNFASQIFQILLVKYFKSWTLTSLDATQWPETV